MKTIAILLLSLNLRASAEEIEAKPVGVTRPAALSVEDYEIPEAVDQVAEIELARTSASREELRAARKGFRAWLAEGSNRREAAAFIKEFRAGVRELRKSQLSPEALDAFRERLAAGGRNFNCAALDAEGGGLHTVIVGRIDFSCREPSGTRRQLSLITVGPGMATLNDTRGGVVACTGRAPGRRLAFGAGFSAGFYVSANVGLYVGRSGLCGALIIGQGFGAGAGLGTLVVDAF